jgi:hypothetical protein
VWHLGRRAQELAPLLHAAGGVPALLFGAWFVYPVLGFLFTFSFPHR